MPLINIFLWLMIILSAVAGYQFLCAYHMAETQANRQMRAVALSPRHRHSAGQRQGSGYAAGQAGSPVYPVRATFFDLTATRGEISTEQRGLEFSLPRTNSPVKYYPQTEKAANHDCHICA